MEEKTEFKTWAIVEVMGHNTYAGYVQEENVFGKQMLRIDVPQIENIPAFTKYISPEALYGITPVSEGTALAKAQSLRKKPFECWGLEQPLMDKLREQGLLIEDKSNQSETEDEENELPF